MANSIDSDFKWYIIISILSVICIVNLICSVYLTLAFCDRFIVECKETDFINNGFYWANAAVAIITFIILILILYYVLKVRKIWETQAIRQKERIQMKRIRQRTAADSIRIGATNQMNTNSVEHIISSSNC